MTDKLVNMGFAIVLTGLILMFIYAVTIKRPYDDEQNRKQSEIIYNSGKQAAQKGLPETMNPYPATQRYDEQRLHWSRGYLSEKMK